MATQHIRYVKPRKPRDGKALIEAEQSWFDGQVHLATWRWIGTDAEIAYQNRKHSLFLTLDGRTALTGCRIGDEVVYEGADRPGALTFVPAGWDRMGWYRDADMRFMTLHLDPTLHNRLPGFAEAAEIPPDVNGSDPVIEGLLRSVGREIDAGIRHDALFMEHVLSLVAHRLASRHVLPPEPPKNGVRLSVRQKIRISDYVEAHLAEDLSLSDLATVAEMSNDSFARAFKKTIGQTPYRYLLERRVRRAEALLADTDDAIAGIAYATGFSSQSHLTTTFRRINGLTPHAFRLARR